MTSHRSRYPCLSLRLGENCRSSSVCDMWSIVGRPWPQARGWAVRSSCATSSRISGIESACPARIEVWQAVLIATESSHDSPCSALGQLAQDQAQALGDVDALDEGRNGAHRDRLRRRTARSRTRSRAARPPSARRRPSPRAPARRPAGSSKGWRSIACDLHLGQDALVEHPLVGGVLVDQIHAVRTLGDDEGAADLAQDAQHRHPGGMRPNLEPFGCLRRGWSGSSVRPELLLR